MNNVKSFSLGAVIAIIVVIILAVGGVAGVIIHNNYDYQLRKADDATNYETKKKVEDYARSLIVQYNSDKKMYEAYKDSESTEQQSWAQEAKIRANNTAVLYNDYLLKNSYVFKDNIPEDIKSELPYID
jgi:hypothetical protein